MTKHIHMINGDTANYKVKVTIQDKVFNVENKEHGGVYTDTGLWKDVDILRLDNPGQLVTKYLTSSRRFIIEEDGNL